MSRDWRLPVNRPEAFMRFYSFHLKYRTHPGCVYFLLPEIADYFGLDEDGRAWLVWLNGNTQNPVTSLLLLEAAPSPELWRDAVALWEELYSDLEWDTDRRHQKSKFGEATERWIDDHLVESPADGWSRASEGGWKGIWSYANSQPYMGRLSAWSMAEYAKILLPGIPDSDDLMLRDWNGSRSHRNGLAFIAGYDSVYWGTSEANLLGIVPRLEQLALDLVEEARDRNPGHPDVGFLTFESALCTYKSWHKPNRRYPNVYADMLYNRIRRAEERIGPRFDLLWEARKKHLPDYLRLEASPTDPGLCSLKQNYYLQTGQPIMMSRDFPDMENGFDESVALGAYGIREDLR